MYFITSVPLPSLSQKIYFLGAPAFSNEGYFLAKVKQLKKKGVPKKCIFGTGFKNRIFWDQRMK
jgi:hypothetical protein